MAEATRCYLHGFYRAAVVIAAAALEKWLKRASGEKHFAQYDDLVRACFANGTLGHDTALKEAAESVFKRRTGVVHYDEQPSHDAAAEVIDLARRIIEHIATLRGD